VQIIPPKFIDAAWKEGAHRLAEACDKSAGEVTPDQLKMLLSRGERILAKVTAASGAVGWLALSVQQLPNIRTLYVYAAQGPGATGQECMDELKALAASEGCSAIRWSCGPGVQRLLAVRHGARPIYTVMEIEV
jgi:hypothetical protein